MDAEPALLQIGPSTARLAIRGATGAELRLLWPIGTQVLQLSVPPRAAQIERAIERIEDVVMPAATHAAGVRRLEVTPGVMALIDQVRGDIGATRSLADIESLFNRVATVAEGRPAAAEGICTDAPAIAALLIVREVMHHLGFVDIGACGR